MKTRLVEWLRVAVSALALTVVAAPVAVAGPDSKTATEDILFMTCFTQLMLVDDLHVSFQYVGSDKTGYIDRVFGGRVGRRIGQFQFFQVIDRHITFDGGGENIDSLIHSFFAHDLSPQDPSTGRCKDQLDGYGFRTRIILGM